MFGLSCFCSLLSSRNLDGLGTDIVLESGIFDNNVEGQNCAVMLSKMRSASSSLKRISLVLFIQGHRTTFFL